MNKARRKFYLFAYMARWSSGQDAALSRRKQGFDSPISCDCFLTAQPRKGSEFLIESRNSEPFCFLKISTCAVGCSLERQSHRRKFSINIFTAADLL